MSSHSPFAVVVLAVVACGPSAAQIKAANDATYKATPREVFSISEKVTAKTYEVGERMPDELVFATKPIWFTDAGRSSRDPAEAQKKAGNMEVSFAVLVTAEGSGAKLVVSATAVDYEVGKAEPRRLDTPSALPKWLNARVDRLRVAIHQRLQASPASGAKPATRAP